MFFFFFKQKTAYEIMPSLVGSEMCIRDRLDTNEYPGLDVIRGGLGGASDRPGSASRTKTAGSSLHGAGVVAGARGSRRRLLGRAGAGAKDACGSQVGLELEHALAAAARHGAG